MMKKKKKTRDRFSSLKHKHCIENQTIDETQPGPIVKDFDFFLDYIGVNRPEASKTNNFFSLSSLESLNERLSRPIMLALQRPQQKSYSNIHGLYLLARATGLVGVEAEKRKNYLVLDEDLLFSWKNLNCTESYFNLLEAWLLRGNLAIVGERPPGFPDHYWKCRDFVRDIPDKGQKISADRGRELSLTYHPGLFNVALLELFGAVDIEHGKPLKGKGWRIVEIRRTPWGDALFELLARVWDFDRVEKYERGDGCLNFGEWQQDLQVFFPDWRNNLTFPQHEFRDGIYVFKVSLYDIWRKISIPVNLSLDQLAHAILDAFRFDYDHLYSFTYKSRFGTEVSIKHPSMNESPHTGEVSIGDLPLKIGQDMIYLYDFGDCWEFCITLDQIGPPNKRIRKPKLLESHGKAPEQYLTIE